MEDATLCGMASEIPLTLRYLVQRQSGGASSAQAPNWALVGHDQVQVAEWPVALYAPRGYATFIGAPRGGAPRGGARDCGPRSYLRGLAQFSATRRQLSCTGFSPSALPTARWAPVRSTRCGSGGITRPFGHTGLRTASAPAYTRLRVLENESSGTRTRMRGGVRWPSGGRSAT